MTGDEAIPVHRRTIALVGLMGVGKSTVGRRLAKRLGLPFADGDVEIEAAAAMTVSDIFAELGEAEFRAGEARVMKRLLEGPRMVLATGGARGITAELLEEIAQPGMRIVLVGRSPEPPAEEARFAEAADATAAPAPDRGGACEWSGSQTGRT